MNGPRRGVTLVNVAGGDPVRIPPDRTLAVGRAATSDVPICDATVSRRHAMVGLTKRGVVVTDLGSRNGTYVNGKRVTSAVLTPGDVVSFGQAAFEVTAMRRRSA
jgi:pSer/pThr/pTyr-binding forkhead associated (FHA) protein